MSVVLASDDPDLINAKDRSGSAATLSGWADIATDQGVTQITDGTIHPKAMSGPGQAAVSQHARLHDSPTGRCHPPVVTGSGSQSLRSNERAGISPGPYSDGATK